MKKGFVCFIAASALLFYSCGSTKTETQNITPTEPAVPEEVLEQPAQEVETEETAADENLTEQQETPESGETEQPAENTEAEDNQQEENTAPETSEDLYPPLEEIAEPSVTDIPPEEFYKPLTKDEPEEAPKIEEPVPQEETEPPVLTNTDDETDSTGELEDPTADPEALEGTEEDSSGDTEALEESEEEPEEEIVIIPSRSVTLKKGETLTVTYPGNGWIYMGSTSEYNNLASRGRKLGSTDTKYTLLAKEAGTQIHHFYKTDNLTGEYIDDYLEVIVLDKKGKSSTIVEAPSFTEVVPKKAETPAKSTATKNREKAAEEAAKQEEEAQAAEQSATQTAAQSKPTDTKTENEVIVIDDEETVIVEEIEPEEALNLSELLDQAVTSLQNKQYNQAYDALLSYLEYSTDGRDQALYLMGQLLEADSPLKNIKEAINKYQTLCENYPASKYWDEANKRIIYLKRFYIDIH